MPSDSTYEIGMLANADAYTANQRGGSGHMRVSVNPDNVKVDFVRAYLPADTKTGGRQNQEIGFSYTLGNSSTPTTPLVLENTNEPNSSLKIIPNPAQDQIFVELPGKFSTINFTIYNLLGERVIHATNPYISTKI